MNFGKYYLDSFWVTSIVALLLFSFIQPMLLIIALSILLYGIERK
ncbi:hypothetical protein [Mammaliicoccus vitulinus]|nr:hypothetical protein [Mammaliicoccus vitulinus]